MELATDALVGQSNVLEQQKFVVWGVFQQVSRSELKKLIEDNGGKVAGSISKNTDFVIAGANMGPSKKLKAESFGVPIISEQDFLDRIEQKDV